MNDFIDIVSKAMEVRPDEGDYTGSNSLRVTPISSCPSRWSSHAATELSTPPLIATAIRSPMGLSFPDENRQNAENLSPVYHVFPAEATSRPASAMPCTAFSVNWP